MKDIIIKETSYDVNIPTERNKTNHLIIKITFPVMLIVAIVAVVL